LVGQELNRAFLFGRGGKRGMEANLRANLGNGGDVTLTSWSLLEGSAGEAKL